ncbi:MAG: tRNA dihydrouridine synthase DusB [Bacteroides sp.]|jgi:putative TIM-barrel protein, nifR3 family
MKIGAVDLGQFPLLLAPMEDVTDQSFRLLCKRFGVDLVYTEFVNSDGLIRGAASSIAKLNLLDEERPAAIQLYGQHLDAMVEATRMACDAHPDIIDLNFGCPVKKIAGRGAGAGMLRDIPLLLSITREVIRVANCPVTVKTRLGWDEKTICIDTLAEQLQDEGIAALTIHGRTRAQLFTGTANWEAIARVKANPRLRIPIIGNGDIVTAEGAANAFRKFGVDGVMIGRATYGRPWIFRDIKHYIATGELLPNPSIEERVRIAREHLQLSLQAKGEVRGIFELRRHLSCYFKGLPDFKSMRRALVTECDPTKLDELLCEVARRYGDWTPQKAEEINNPWS